MQSQLMQEALTERKIALTVNKKKIYWCQLITSDKIMLMDCCGVVLFQGYCFNLTLFILAQFSVVDKYHKQKMTSQYHETKSILDIRTLLNGNLNASHQPISYTSLAFDTIIGFVVNVSMHNKKCIQQLARLITSRK